MMTTAYTNSNTPNTSTPVNNPIERDLPHSRFEFLNLTLPPHANCVHDDIINYFQALRSLVVDDDSLTPHDFEVLYDSIESIANLLFTGDHPERHFDFISNGAYKEVFDLIPGKYVIKFCVEQNDTRSELHISRVTTHSFGPTFVPLYGAPISHTLPTAYIEVDEDAEQYDSVNRTWVPNPDYEASRFNYILLQKVVTPFSQLDHHYFNEEIAPRSTFLGLEFIEIAGYKIPFEAYWQSGIDVLEWIEAFLRLYGEEQFVKLSYFLVKNSISDLTPRNIGMDAEGHPVIFDCLSRPI